MLAPVIARTRVSLMLVFALTFLLILPAIPTLSAPLDAEAELKSRQVRLRQLCAGTCIRTPTRSRC